MPASSPLTPKSALRHRPLDSSDEAPKTKPVVTRASRPAQSPKRIVPPASCSPTQKTSVKKNSSHLNLTSIGFGMIVALIAVLLGHVLLSWWSTTWDDIHYGTPRTYQVDAFVGHEAAQTPSHFLAVNLRGQIEILEWPGDDPAKMKVYLGPHITGPDAANVPVTLQFVDPHHAHHPDMLVQFQGTQVVFHNVHGAFQVGQP